MCTLKPFCFCLATLLVLPAATIKTLRPLDYYTDKVRQWYALTLCRNGKDNKAFVAFRIHRTSSFCHEDSKRKENAWLFTVVTFVRLFLIPSKQVYAYFH